MNIISLFNEIWRGKDIYRIFMNEECRSHTVTGITLDIGSSLNLASYHRFLNHTPDSSVQCVDLNFEGGDGRRIDLEADVLPQKDESIDTVLLFNVLEHIYNYPLVVSEIRRILKKDGVLIGAVPFLVAYHPDPHDYWRYTKESLERIFMTAGFRNITITSFGRGPCTAGFLQIEMGLPRVLKIACLPCVLFCDFVINWFRPKMNKDRFFLGLFFSVSK